MNSPFTGGNATLVEEEATTTYRGEVFSYTRYYYRCDDTGITFTDAETDGKGLEQIYSQYREKYGIPAPDKIKAIRKQYGLSAVTMSKILGIGDNQYGLYENGEMPTKNIGRTIATLKDKNIFRAYVDIVKNQLSEKEYDRIVHKLEEWSFRSSFEVDNDKYSFDWYFSAVPGNSVFKEAVVVRWNRIPQQQSFIMA